eukprot:CAMPEP_0119041468 /NCGR_PEP_ID=MMETSP1177-20130426/12224_1 /TAXON_ID=2985 /ORGANISM="Ochromonas sp, Strain CCMP1899" /LENGTH=81 /DNA_ID=CAMNT_0007007529 /DNA_START=124 /DNA_END=369 /DNA_ORIENTATION=+
MSSEAGRDHNEKGEDSRVRAIWPKLQGESVIDVEGIIKQDRPDLTIQRVPEGSMVTMDHRMDRVRIFHNADGKVSQPPRVG